MRNIRPVSPSDLELICRHRHEMFREAGRTEADLAPMAEPFRRWLAKRLEDGAYFGFVAENAGRAIGAVGLMAIDWPPILRTRSMIGAGMYLTFSWNPPIAGAGLPMRS